jgi:hypothetical protein
VRSYVFSGARYKVTVAKQTAVFMFALSGIRVPKRDEKPDAGGWWLQKGEGDELSNAALNFSRERLHQTEVTIEIDGLDKGGNFVGTLLQGKKVYMRVFACARQLSGDCFGLVGVCVEMCGSVRTCVRWEWVWEVRMSKRFGVLKFYVEPCSRSLGERISIHSLPKCRETEGVQRTRGCRNFCQVQEDWSMYSSSPTKLIARTLEFSFFEEFFYSRHVFFSFGW